MKKIHQSGISARGFRTYADISIRRQLSGVRRRSSTNNFCQLWPNRKLWIKFEWTHRDSCLCVQRADETSHGLKKSAEKQKQRRKFTAGGVRSAARSFRGVRRRRKNGSHGDSERTTRKSGKAEERKSGPRESFIVVDSRGTPGRVGPNGTVQSRGTVPTGVVADERGSIDEPQRTTCRPAHSLRLFPSRTVWCRRPTEALGWPAWCIRTPARAHSHRRYTYLGRSVRQLRVHAH